MSGIGAQNRPGMTTKVSASGPRSRLSFHVHPPVLGNFEAATNGAGHVDDGPSKDIDEFDMITLTAA